jgi:hypothetical protein
MSLRWLRRGIRTGGRIAGRSGRFASGWRLSGLPFAGAAGPTMSAMTILLSKKPPGGGEVSYGKRQWQMPATKSAWRRRAWLRQRRLYHTADPADG